MRWQARVGDRLHQVELTRKADGAVEAAVDGRRYSLSVTEPQPGVFSILADGVSHEAILQTRQGRCSIRFGPWSFDVQPELPGGAELRSARADGSDSVRAVMPGRVLRVLVAPGQQVSARQGLVVVEAMKMENEVTAPRDGVVKEVKVAPGRAVETGQVLVVLE